MKQFLQDHSLRGLALRHTRLAGFLACLLIMALIVGWAAREITHAVIRANDARTLSHRVAAVARQQARDAAQATGALCTLRADLEQRVASSEGFLREHPEGVAGIPARTIRESIANQRRTIAALSGLNC
jgi:hypothetical protein